MQKENDYRNWYMGSSISALTLSILSLFMSFIPCLGVFFSLMIAFSSITFLIIGFILAYEYKHAKGILYASMVILCLTFSFVFFQFYFVKNEIKKAYDETIKYEEQTK